MAVQVQQPGRKRRDVFDLLLGGLQAASAFTNIQKAQAELEAIPGREARAERAEERGFAATFQEVPEATPGAVRLTPPGREEARAFLPRTQLVAGAKAKKESTKDEETLRKEWLKNKQTITTQDVAAAAGKVAKVAGGPPSAAGDISLVFSYMKLLDPGSVVREGEQALARNAAGVPERIRTLYNNVLEGESLSPNQRRDFAKRAVDLYDVHWQKQKAFNQAFEGLAERGGLDPRNVVLELGLDPTEFNEIIEGYLQTSGNIGTGAGGLLPKGREPSRQMIEDEVSEFRSLIGF